MRETGRQRTISLLLRLGVFKSFLPLLAVFVGFEHLDAAPGFIFRVAHYVHPMAGFIVKFGLEDHVGMAPGLTRAAMVGAPETTIRCLSQRN